MTSEDVARGLPPDVANQPSRFASALLTLSDGLQRARRAGGPGADRRAALVAYVEALNPSERLQALAGLQLLLPLFARDDSYRATTASGAVA